MLPAAMQAPIPLSRTKTRALTINGYTGPGGEYHHPERDKRYAGHKALVLSAFLISTTPGRHHDTKQTSLKLIFRRSLNSGRQHRPPTTAVRQHRTNPQFLDCTA